MQLHTLFNVDDPICLYCQASCDVFETSIGHPALVIDEYTCQQCQEKYEINHIDDKYFGFGFSCKDLRVFHNYDHNQFGLLKKESDLKVRDNYIWIPYFDVNFSNKEDLYHKLKVYITFA
jgi:hypothetical protein